VALFDGLPDGVLADLAEQLRVQRCRARQPLITRDDVDRDCFFVISGTLRVIAWSAAGREVSFRDVGPGQSIGELAALDGRPRSATVVALTDSVLARLSPEALTALLQRHWPICERLLRHLAATARLLTDRVVELSTLGTEQRLCAELLRCVTPGAADGPLVLAPAPSHSELAARIGTLRPEVTRALARLEERGLVQRGRGSLTLLDLAGLAQRVDSAD
jgi:CRP-like cAMP-binding protein